MHHNEMPDEAISKRNTRGERTRSAVLDAAEIIFLRRGYEGASIRHVASAADVPLGAVHYHFPSKQSLFHATIWRREPEIGELIAKSFAHIDAHGAQRDVEQIIKAYLTPLLAACGSAGHPLRNYVRLTSLMTTSFHIAEVRDAMRGFTRINDPLVARLRPLLPSIAETDLLSALYALVSTIIFAEQDMGFAEELTDGALSSTHPEKLIEPLTAFFSAGLRHLNARS
jgi:AcrR family transcriptional regulator